MCHTSDKTLEMQRDEDGNVESQRNLGLVKSIIFKYNNDGFFEVTKLILKSI